MKIDFMPYIPDNLSSYFFRQLTFMIPFHGGAETARPHAPRHSSRNLIFIKKDSSMCVCVRCACVLKGASINIQKQTVYKKQSKDVTH